MPMLGIIQYGPSGISWSIEVRPSPRSQWRGSVDMSQRRDCLKTGEMRQLGHILGASWPLLRRKQQIHEVQMLNGGSLVTSNGCASCWSNGVDGLRRRRSAQIWSNRRTVMMKTKQQARPTCDSKACRRIDFSLRLSLTQPLHLVKKTGHSCSWMSSKSSTACVRSFGNGERRAFDSNDIADVRRQCDFSSLC